jgi:hypothetical protein
VYVEAVDGDEFKPGLYTPDLLAIADVRDAIQHWGRYTITVEREKADLVFVVRKGRLAEADLGGGVGGGANPQGAQGPGQQRSRGTVLDVGGEAGPEDDLLEVCQFNPNGKLSGPLWIHTFKDGLGAPRLILFEQFKEEVEKAYPDTPANTAAKP